MDRCREDGNSEIRGDPINAVQWWQRYGHCNAEGIAMFGLLLWRRVKNALTEVSASKAWCASASY